MRVETVNNRQFLLQKFKEMFPGLYKDGMTISEANDILIINPTPGKRGARYYFNFYPNGRWKLRYE